MKIKLVKIIFIIMMIFIMFGNINCNATTLDDTQVEETEVYFDESDPMSTTVFIEDTDISDGGAFVIGAGMRSIISIINKGTIFIFVYFCLDAIIRSIKAKMIKIRIGCLKLILFLFILVNMVYFNTFELMIWKKIHANSFISYGVWICIISIVVSVLVYGFINLILKLIKKIINKKKVDNKIDNK